MIVMISSQDNTLESKPSSRFGRSPFFIRYDLVNHQWNAMDNPAISQPGGAGVSAAQLCIDHQASAVISGRFGPNAHQVLETAGIDMYIFDSSCTTIQKVIELFENNSLKPVAHPG